MGALYPDLSGAMRTLRLTGGTTHDQRRNKEEGEGLTQGCGPRLSKIGGGSKVDIKIRRWEGVREWGNRWMLASPGPWRLGVAVALRSRSPQTAAKLARSGSIRFYSILFYNKWTINNITLLRVIGLHV